MARSFLSPFHENTSCSNILLKSQVSMFFLKSQVSMFLLKSQVSMSPHPPHHPLLRCLLIKMFAHQWSSLVVFIGGFLS